MEWDSVTLMLIVKSSESAWAFWHSWVLQIGGTHVHMVSMQKASLLCSRTLERAFQCSVRMGKTWVWPGVFTRLRAATTAQPSQPQHTVRRVGRPTVLGSCLPGSSVLALSPPPLATQIYVCRQAPEENPTSVRSVGKVSGTPPTLIFTCEPTRGRNLTSVRNVGKPSLGFTH